MRRLVHVSAFVSGIVEVDEMFKDDGTLEGVRVVMQANPKIANCVSGIVTPPLPTDEHNQPTILRACAFMLMRELEKKTQSEVSVKDTSQTLFHQKPAEG